MLYSKLFGKTEKEAKRDMTMASHKLLYQAGFVRESTAGRYFFLPLGMRVRDKIMKIIEKEMDKLGAQKMLTPVLHPIELWKETNRTNSVGFELTTIKDRRGAEFVLGGTAEEMLVDLVRKFQISYKDMPFNLYQFSSKFRDEMRARGGLLRVREFMMKDAYSFHKDEADFKKEYERMWEVYLRIYKKLGLDAVPVEADNGYIGGDYCHEFQVVSEAGEDTLFYVPSQKKYFNKEIAPVQAPAVKYEDKEELAMEDVKGEGIIGVEELAKFLEIPVEKTTKTLLFVGDDDRKIAVAVRGGYDIDETKVMRVAKTETLELASDKEIEELTGAKVGYLGPLNLPEEVEVYFDESTSNRLNFECGANKTDYHTINANWGRDLEEPKEFYDLKEAREGDLYPETGEVYEVHRSTEVGNIFQLGHHYTKKMKGANFITKDGKELPFYMGCYGIGVGRTLATVVEQHHDKYGIIWPENIAPYQIHLVGLTLDDKVIKAHAKKIYKELTNKGYEVLYDDREDVRPGEKFNDADLIGVPYRLVVSKKLEEKIELKKRGEKEMVVFDTVKDLLSYIDKV